MSIRVVHRPARVTRPLQEAQTTTLASPPPIGDGPNGIPMQSLLPIVGSVSSMTMMMMLRNNPIMVMIGAVVLVVALVGGVGMAFTQRGNAVRQRRLQRERYLDYLEKTRLQLRRDCDAYRDRALELHPAPSSLVEFGQNPARRWERRPSETDFLKVRIGTGDITALPVELPPEQNPVQPYDPVLQAAAARICDKAGVIQGLPVLLDLAEGGEISIIGERVDTVNLCRAMAAQLTAVHAPNEVHLAAVIPADALPLWRGFDLLPHANASANAAGVFAARRVAPSIEKLWELLSDELRDRAAVASAARRSGRNTKPVRLVVFIDEEDHEATAVPPVDAVLDLTALGVTVVHVVNDRLKEPTTVVSRVNVGPDTAVLEVVGTDAAPVRFVPDLVNESLLEVIARPLAALRLTRASTVDSEGTAVPDVTELLGVSDVDRIDVADVWAPRSAGDFLRVPIGVDDRGGQVLVDLKESAQLGMGPHGICIGATGSGKSELLRTLILGLAMTHPPEDLAMILVDYKGGAAFAPFIRLPHVAGVIDNLADDPQLTERARASINGEVVRRQQLLKEADNSASISHYRRLRTERPDLPALPHLFLVIDEFGELLTAEPDFVDLLLTIGRIGRSIGVHLLLSSQRIEAGKLRGLDTYLSYRIGLRTFSEAESTVVLDNPDAFHLPAIPGYGFLKVDTSVYTRFRAGYVSGPVGAPVESDAGGGLPAEPVALPLYDLGGPIVDLGEEPSLEPTAPAVGRTLVQAAVGQLSRNGERTRPVWLPPLPPSVALGRVLPSGLGQLGSGGGLRVPMGLLDDPIHQQQGPLLLDLNRSGGHVTVTGAPQSGRSTFLRTLAVSLAMTHTPREVSIYGMDLTGGGMSRIEGFPHVGGVATRGHRERLGRVLEELSRMLLTREQVFRDYGLDSLADMRRQHAAGRLPQLPSADIVLMVDGMGALRSDFEELEEPLGRLLERGGSFGIHVVLTLNRWNELRMALQALIGTRLELKLNDASDSQINRKLAATLRADQPGRLLTDEKLLAQIALPVLEESDRDLGEAITELAGRSAEQWSGPGAAPIRLLPDELSPAELPDALEAPDHVPIGLRQEDMSAVALELSARDPHLVVLGDSECGKTTLLRGLIRGVIERHTPEQLVIALMDARGGLASEVPEEFLGGHAANGRMGRMLSESIAAELEKRQAERGIGPRILVVVDDYDVISAGGNQPLLPLMPYLASARDLRLNVVVTRPVAGASRAMFDTALQALRDTGGTTLVMSGDRGEGQLLPKLYAEPMIAGRGRIARRGLRPALIQVANFGAEGSGGNAS